MTRLVLVCITIALALFSIIDSVRITVREKGFQARVQCAVVKSRKEEKIGGYADISGVNIFS